MIRQSRVTLLFLAAGALLAQAQAQQPIPLGREFAAGASVLQSLETPAVCQDASGQFVMAWADAGPDASIAVYVQRRGAGGELLGPSFQANSPARRYNFSPALACSPAGEFVLVWQSSDDEFPFHSTALAGRRFDHEGTPQGEELRLNEPSPSVWVADLDVALRPDGGFITTWAARSQPSWPRGDRILVRSFDASSRPLGSPVVASQIASDGIYGKPKVSCGKDGSFVTTWGVAELVEVKGRIVARRFQPDGAPVGAEFQVSENEYTDPVPDVSHSPDGGFVITWAEWDLTQGFGFAQSFIYTQRYDLTGTAQGDPIRLASELSDARSSNPSIAHGPGGDFVVSWQDNSFCKRYDGHGYGCEEIQPARDGGAQAIVARHFNADGTPDGSEFVANTLSKGSELVPTVSMGSSDSFIVAWTHAGNYPDLPDVRDQVFSLASPLPPPDLEISVSTTSDQTSPAVAMDRVGNFTAVWIDTSRNPRGDVVGQRRGSLGQAAGPKLRIGTARQELKASPAIAMNGAGESVVVWSAGKGGATGSGVSARRYDSAGRARGTAFRVNRTAGRGDTMPAVAMDEQGGFAVSWTDPSRAGGCFLQRFAPSGAPLGAELRLDPTRGAALGSSIVLDPRGSAFVVWADPAGIHAQRVSAKGKRQGQRIQVSNRLPGGANRERIVFSRPSVSVDPGGRFVVAWSERVPAQETGPGSKVLMRRIRKDGRPSGPVLEVTPAAYFAEVPRVAHDGAGRFLLACTNRAECMAPGTDGGCDSPAVTDGSGDAVFGQVFRDDGTPEAEAFLLNTGVEADQLAPAVAGRSGSFAAVWLSAAENSGGRATAAETSLGIYGKLLAYP